MNRPSSLPLIVTLLSTLAAALLGGAGHAAEPQAILARGFEPDQIYDFNEIDHVNLFNGNLVVTLPIGQRFPVGGGFEYGFSLVYNSHLWDYVVDCPDDGLDALGEPVLTDPGAVGDYCLRGIPNPKSNAGTSWRLTLGELYAPESTVVLGPEWMFVGPDGSERHFAPAEGQTGSDFPQYSRDGAHLRLRATSASSETACLGVTGQCMAVDLPDGTVYAFEPSTDLAGWRLHRIEDPFGNQVTVIYEPSLWKVQDSAGREHTVELTDGEVSSVTLESFDGQPATYGFDVADSSPIRPGCPNNYDADGAGVFETLRQLTALTRPDGSRFTFSYVTDDGFGGICSHYEGRLNGITLPTGGTIAYEYGSYHYPVSACETPPIRSGYEKQSFLTQWGIARRTTAGIHGTVASDRHYVDGGLSAAPSRLAVPGTCILPRTTYTDVYEKADGGRYRLTRSFFAIAQPASNSLTDEREPYEHTRYGLPIDHLSPDPDHPASFRSSMVFDCPSYPPATESYGTDWPDEARHLRVPSSCYDADGMPETDDRYLFADQVHGLRDRYLEHEGGAFHYCDGDFGTNPECETSHWRVRRETTTFYDSIGEYEVETERSDFDGYGNYGTTTSSSNSPDSVQRTTTVAYRPAVDGDTWLLRLFDERTVMEGGHSSRTSYGFDRTTGFLSSKTTHRDAGDVVTTFTPDAFGNIETETYSGGDPLSADYFVWNEFAHGALARSEYQRDGQTVLVTVDADIDQSTALPTASRDPAGLETRYSFDAMGRLTELAQQGTLAGAAKTYQYAAFDPVQSTRASATITRGDTSSQLFFDGLGRVQEERTSLPGGVVNRRVTSFAPMGGTKTVTTLHDAEDGASAHATTTDYDVFGRPSRIVRPDDGSTSSGVSKTFLWYRGPFQTIREVDHVETPAGPQPLRTNHHYDHQGRLVEVEEIELDQDHESGEATLFEVRLQTRYRYDEADHLVRVSQGGGTQIRTFDYDAAGFLTRECHPELDGDCIEYGGFDALGNPGVRRYSRTGGEPFELTYTYDGAERLTQVRGAEDGSLLEELFYADGKLVGSKRHNRFGSVDIVATVTNSYQGVGGRLSRRTVTTGGDGEVPRVRFSTDFGYDLLGNLAEITYPGCIQVGCTAEPRTVTNTYTHGVLTGVGVPGAPSRFAALSYHPNLTPDRISHGNGVVDDYLPDPSQMPRSGGVEVRTGTEAGVGVLWKAGYAFDGAGNLVARSSLARRNDGSQIFDQTDQFRYDNAFNRLVSSTIHYPFGSSFAAESRNFTYDPFGNLATISSSANPRILSPDAATNRLESPFTYDVAGNLTSQPTWDFNGYPTTPTAWYYSYDAFNRMTRARNASGSITRDYVYTADGERLAVLAPGRELWTLRGPDNRVLRDFEYVSTGWRRVEDYIHRGSGLLATIDATGDETHYHLDHLGTPRIITDAAKQVLARHVHAPYGEELTSTSQNELRMKFGSHERDDFNPYESSDDLDFMHARHYSQHLGRFLTLDPVRLRSPLKFPQLWNRYSYAIGSPLKYVDPNGQVIAFAPELRTAVIETYEKSRSFRTYYDKHHINPKSLGRIQGPGSLQRSSGAIRGATVAASPMKFVCGKDGCTPRTEKTLTMLPRLGGNQLRAILGHEIYHMIEFFEYGSPSEAPGARESGSGRQGDYETDPAVEVQRSIEEELLDPSDDIQLSDNEKARLFGYSDSNPDCAKKGGSACPEPKEE